jgi:hypothetical protein
MSDETTQSPLSYEEYCDTDPVQAYEIAKEHLYHFPEVLEKLCLDYFIDPKHITLYKNYEKVVQKLGENIICAYTDIRFLICYFKTSYNGTLFEPMLNLEFSDENQDAIDKWCLCHLEKMRDEDYSSDENGRGIELHRERLDDIDSLEVDIRSIIYDDNYAITIDNPLDNGRQIDYPDEGTSYSYYVDFSDYLCPNDVPFKIINKIHVGDNYFLYKFGRKVIINHDNLEEYICKSSLYFSIIRNQVCISYPTGTIFRMNSRPADSWLGTSVDLPKLFKELVDS